MKYDFTTVPERKGLDALALDAIGNFGPSAPKEGLTPIPMWVADMNFAVPQCITDSVRKRLEHPFFGYFFPREELYAGIAEWQKSRNGMNVTKDQISFDTGVLGGVTSALNVYCQRGDKVLVHSPTYIGFSGVFKNNGYNPVLSPLVKDEKGIWRMDFDDMEEKLKKEHIHAMVFCSPHNPAGRVWERHELERLSELCEKYSVELVSDEIWSDIILPGFKHITTQSVSEYLKNHTVACYAPSKTFNLAGFTESYRIIQNPVLKDKVDKEASLSHYNELNMLSMYAHIGACSDEAKDWLDELCSVLGENIGYACGFIEKNLPGLKLSKPQGTYLLFIDCSGYCEKSGRSFDEVLKALWDCGIDCNDGRAFHGECHIRLNLALPKSLVEEAFRRMKEFVFV